MFDCLLKTALDTGGEVIVETKYHNDSVKGRVLDFDGAHFSVFHSGTAGGMLWVFRVEDVASCGLVLALPTPLKDLGLAASAEETDQVNELPPRSRYPESHHPEEGELL